MLFVTVVGVTWLEPVVRVSGFVMSYGAGRGRLRVIFFCRKSGLESGLDLAGERDGVASRKVGIRLGRCLG